VPPADEVPEGLRTEHRWSSAVAVLAVAVLHALLPPQLKVQPSSWLPWVTVGVLLVLIVADPGRIDRVNAWTRGLTDALIGLLTAANAYAAVMLVAGIIQNQSFTKPVELLASGGVVWISNVLVFALWYWDLDQGGPAVRAQGSQRPPAFIFPEMQHPQHVPAGWRPVFVDYLAFSFATATAFSPTDVSAVRPWAKLMVIAESLISLALAALVIARAINVLT
jgi:uncharacterized membrane protein